MADTRPIGIIAGNRALPLLFAREARQSGIHKIVAAAFEGETDPALAQHVDEIVWLKVGQLSKLIKVFKDRGIDRCVMAGQIAPTNLFDLRPDLRAMMLLVKLKEKNAHTIFGAIADELAKDGITLVEATPWLQSVVTQPNFLLGRELTADQRADVAFGYRIAKEISRLEIGQSVVVKEGTVLAVEGFEGTDKCLERGGSLAGPKGGAVAVKVARSNHDMRFDIPCFGAATVQMCTTTGIAVLAVEPRKSLMLEGDRVRELLKSHRVTLTATPEALSV